MKLYYHVVGKEGSSRDFPKTVFTRIPITTVERNVPNHVPGRAEILKTLIQLFPSGDFNCWGVPTGAESAVAALQPGDVVLLVATIAGEGDIPALCEVKAYWNIPLFDLSRALWGEAGFPYIFFFDTERLNLTWREFAELLNYTNYRPPALFHSVKDSRLEEFEPPGGIVPFIRRNYGIEEGKRVKESTNDSSYNLTQTSSEPAEGTLSEIEIHSHEYDFLPATEREAIVLSRLGQGKFRDNLINYWSACAVTGVEAVPVLRASHIKPWRESDNSERLDTFNGLLLTPNLDVLFDLGYITFTDDGVMLLSSQIPGNVAEELGIVRNMRLRKVDSQHLPYLRFHRTNVFRP